MATITLEYNARNRTANRIIDVIMAMNNVFKVKTPATKNASLTRKAIEDVEKGNIITCGSYEDYLKLTAKYA
jgi:aerobic-type carbon monoxide dehydrogenase small subunit (CoxS/CutS family)